MAGAVFQERSSPTASAMSTSSTSFVQSCHRLRVRSAFPAPSLGRPAPRLGSRTSQSSRTMVRASSPLSSPLFLASAAGLATGTLVVLLNDFVHLVQDFLFELPGLSILAPVISASFVSLLLLARGAKGLSGSSDLAALKASGGAPPKDSGEAPLRALAAGLTLAGGNSLGPEGPSVEIGANVAASLSGYQKNTTDSDRALRQNLLAAGCASGIAAGFNAPVAGLFFALESIQSNCAPDDARAKGPPMQLLAAVLAATATQLHPDSIDKQGDAQTDRYIDSYAKMSPLEQRYKVKIVTNSSIPLQILRIPCLLLVFASAFRRCCLACASRFGIVVLLLIDIEGFRWTSIQMHTCMNI